MRGVIWTCDRGNDGIEQLKYIRDRYLWAGVSVVREVYTRDKALVEFSNGDYWRVVGNCESNRAIRSNIALIDARISNEFVRTVILPTLVSFNGPQYYEFFMPRSDNHIETNFK
jgi:hypothetical protein